MAADAGPGNPARRLGAGPVRLAGATPSAHDYLLRPHRIWKLRGAACVLDGRDPGRVIEPQEQPRIGSFVLPRRALFAAGAVSFGSG